MKRMEKDLRIVDVAVMYVACHARDSLVVCCVRVFQPVTILSHTVTSLSISY